MHRTFDEHSTRHIDDNELYTQFKYTKLEGFDYNGGDGTISRRDPTKVLFENGKYHVWYTKRQTPTKPRGPQKCTDTIPSTDWDLSDLWYATSDDGFIWEEQGVAVRVIASRKYRIAQIMEREAMNQAAAERHIDAVDLGRREFVQRFFHHDIDDPHLYHLIVNVERLGIDGAADEMITAISYACGVV